MTPDQKHDANPISAGQEPSPEVNPSESSSTAGLHDDDRSNTGARDDRRGWRAYFPAAARKELKTEPVEENDSAAAIARLVTRLSILICALFLFAVSVSANTYIVSTTADNGNNSNPTFGSLRKAIRDANTVIGADTIIFQIPGGGVHTITPPVQLPDITDTLTIDGYTQSGASYNTQQTGSNAVLTIELNGASAGAFAQGLVIKAPNCFIRGLVINRFNTAITIDHNGGQNAVVGGCFIGTNAAGTAALPNILGIYVGDSPGNLIGGVFPSGRNLISGHDDPSGAGIRIVGATSQGNLVAGNLIGTDKSGTGKIPNRDGIDIFFSLNNTIGGAVTSAANVISGNSEDGVLLLGAQNTVIGNRIGTDALGTSKLGNKRGINIGQASNRIGDATLSGSGNIVSGNDEDGLLISGSAANSNLIQGNFIGTAKNGASALGNGKNGVYLTSQAAKNSIGGTGAGNVIAFNSVGVVSDTVTGDNAIRQNAIFSNTKMGIDLAPVKGAVNPNDQNDGDTGANNLQNYPVITAAFNSNLVTTVAGTLNSATNQQFKIEFFANQQCDSSTYGEGQIFLGTATVNTAGNDASFIANFPGLNLGQFISATATDATGNTSEFAQCVQVTAPPPPPNISINDVSLTEGDSGQKTMQFTVSLSTKSYQDVFVSFTTANGTASNADDYIAQSGNLKIPAGSLTGKINVNIYGDSDNEMDETLFVNLSNPFGAVITKAQGTGTINNNDLPPNVGHFIAIVDEGDSGLKAMTFKLVLTNKTYQTVTVDYVTTQMGNATEGVDFQAAAGTITFAPGEQNKTITLNVIGDTVDEPNEIVFIKLFNFVNTKPLASLYLDGIITDDDNPQAPGTLSFGAPTYVVNENGVTATINIKRTGGAGGAVSVKYTTTFAGGTATQNTDYAAASGTQTWADGDSADKTFAVTINDDQLDELDETVNLLLSNPTGGAVLGNPDAVLTIVDNDAPPTVSINDVSVSEGNAGTTLATFSVSLSSPTSNDVQISYHTQDGTAQGGSDFVSLANASLTIPGGSITGTINVQVNGDTQSEPDETFVLFLDSVSNATFVDNQGTGSITNDDAPPPVGSVEFSVSSYTVNENSGTATVTVKRTGGSNGTISVQYSTIAGGTATAGADYAVTSGMLSWPDGDASDKTFAITLADDQLDEPDETVNLELTNPTGGSSLGAQSAALLNIDDDEQPPSLSISDASLPEGNNGQTSFVFNATLSNASSQTVTVEFATAAGGSASSIDDYQTVSGTLTFAPGETSKPLTVLINGDAQAEPDETFIVQLNNSTNAGISKAQGTGTIINDDAAPTPTPVPTPTATPTPTPAPTATPSPTPTSTPSVSIADASLAEGNIGTTSFDFTVTLSAVSSQTVTVEFATGPAGTASVGDFLPVSGLLIFNPGETSKVISVLVNGDSQDEPNETFFVNLSNPANATIAKAQGAGTIINDDAVGVATFDFSQPSYGVAEEFGAVTLTVIRTGNTAGPASVDYATADASATQRADYEIAAGTLNFAPGETSRIVTVLINDDAYVEGSESFKIVLGSPAGAVLGQQSAANVVIADDVPESFTNPLDEAQSFVYTNYHDFLNREPDAAGLAFWTSQIMSCGNDAKCIEERRINVSASFFLSIEFQETGYLRYLLERESFGSIPRYTEFMRDVQEISRGVIVNAPGWEQKLKDNQQQFADKWINRPSFKAVYDPMSNVDYVNALYVNAGILPTPAERESLVNALDAGNESRSAILLEVAANVSFRQKESSAAFVMMQYFGYLRRDPDAAPDADLSGYNFWLNKLNQFSGNYVDAEMIKAFITSFEYRGRFAQ